MVLTDLREQRRRQAPEGVAKDDIQQWEDTHGQWRSQTQHSGNIRLWDNLGGTWSAPISQEVAYKVYLRMVALYCSGCGSPGAEDGQVSRHIELVRQRVAEHENAELEPFARDGISGNTCSACGGQFQLRKNQGQRHIESYASSVGVAHKDATEKRILRYGLEPRATVLDEQPVPVELQGMRMPRQVSGKHRRGRRGGRRHK
jgi:hypothetical protein